MAIRKLHWPTPIPDPASPEIHPLTLFRSSLPTTAPRAPHLLRSKITTGLALLALSTACLLLLGCGMKDPAEAATIAPTGQKYELKLHHLHTGESLDVVYRVGDTYIPEAMNQLNHFLRDHRTEDQSHYDPHEFDLLHNLMARLGRPQGLIDVVCGYRTPESNEYLRNLGPETGVAKHSQHIEAKAIDIRVPGIRTRRLRDAALSLQAGGVGYYPLSQFVHVDVGPVRHWTFDRHGEY